MAQNNAIDLPDSPVTQVGGDETDSGVERSGARASVNQECLLSREFDQQCVPLPHVDGRNSQHLCSGGYELKEEDAVEPQEDPHDKQFSAQYNMCVGSQPDTYIKQYRIRHRQPGVYESPGHIAEPYDSFEHEPGEHCRRFGIHNGKPVPAI